MTSSVHTQGAVLLNDGRVLIAGGNSASGPVNGAAIWTPSTNAWTATGNMATTRAFFALNLLSDGRVLAAGGLVNVLLATTATTEIYTPGDRRVVGRRVVEHGALQRCVRDAFVRSDRPGRSQRRVSHQHIRILRRRAQHMDASIHCVRRHQPNRHGAHAQQRPGCRGQHRARCDRVRADVRRTEWLCPVRPAQRDPRLLRQHQRGRCGRCRCGHQRVRHPARRGLLGNGAIEPQRRGPVSFARVPISRR